MDTVKVGVVGIGHLGNYHLQKYHKIPNCKIVGVADISVDRAQKAAGTYGCSAVSDHRKLIGSVDAVSIAVPTISHHSVAKDFLEAGIDVLLEKPIATTIEEADDLVAVAEEKGVIFQIGFLERFNPAIVALTTLMGKPLFIETHRLHPFFERGTDVDVILDLMIHDLDIILHFVKSPIQSVEAVGVSVLSDKVDIANARITFSSGCVANITASRVTGKTMQKIRFFGLEGYHAVDYEKRELISLSKRAGADGKIEIYGNPVEIKLRDPLEEEIRAFLDSVISRKPPSVSGKDGRDALELAILIAEKARKAQETLP
ncbi:MAG TPA: UDP-N-acetyl-D-glucosamine dehydrogenase [Syntrophaceae bacterium]|jgi:predicted dehydrogenase|nr:UDP-N-acetyl-D-glucosamine dehydrogenase [Syntrophaceae bacterium]